MATPSTPEEPEAFQVQFDRLVHESGGYNVDLQSKDYPPPGHIFGMYTFDYRSMAWACRPCGKIVSWGHLTSVKH